MAHVSSAQKAREERRLRSPGFLRSLGVERTTAVLLGAVAGLIFAFVSILTSEGPADADTAAATQTESVFEEAEVVDDTNIVNTQ